MTGIWPAATPLEIALVAAVALIAGVVRGFSGFGSALMIVPVMAAVMDPKIAVPAATVVHIITSIQLLPEAIRDAEWERTVPLSVAGVVAMPAGAWFLATQDAGLLRQVIGVLIVVFAIVMLRGWRYTGRTRGWATAIAGAVGGLIVGAALIGGPPVIMFLMAGPYKASENRAAIILFFLLVQIFALLTYWYQGLMVPAVIGAGLYILPSLAIGTLIGQRLFRSASEEGLRRFALLFLLVIGVATLLV